MNYIRPGLYRHFKKGHVYDVVFVAKHTENSEELVIYRGPDGVINAKPYDLFTSPVEVDGKLILRYERIE